MLMFLLGAAAVACLFYYYVLKPLRYWRDRGVEQGNPLWIFGHYLQHFLRRQNGADILKKVYQQSPKARYTGMYRFSEPILMVRDPDLIKQITIKDFESFLDHTEFIPPDADPMWAKNLLNLTGTNWRNMRSYLSPSFTSSKMRTLFVLMTECAESLVKHLLDKNQDMVTTEIKDIFSRYSNDVIATTAFGVKVDSLSQPNNEFYKMGKKVSNFSGFWKNLQILAYWCIPLAKNFLKIQFITDDVRIYFSKIMNETIKAREEKGIVRKDVIHLLLEARKRIQKQKENDLVTEGTSDTTLDVSNDDITANALIFFIAGFESVSSFISFATYELAINPNVQEKLRKEVHETLQKCEGKVTYEALLDMKYMDMVVSETLRKWPSFIGTDRICTKSYTIESVTPREKPVHIEKGTALEFPILAIHYDPQYFPDPERFDPERFSDENKGNIQSGSYFPFGIGPRTCIGNRFSLLEGKILLFHLLTTFEFVPVKETEIPLKLSKNTVFNINAEGGIWLGLKRCK